MTTPNFDTMLDRLRERQAERANDYGIGTCENCRATLTAADVEGGECSQCRSSIESDDEDLNGWEAGL